MYLNDTITAISSAVGPAARMIVRASGPLALGFLPRLSRPIVHSPSASRTTLRFGGLRVPAWVYSFAAPRSYSGDDLVEFHIPGNPLLARMLLDELFRQGARPAEPGEFTARAYFQGRIDLAQAEGVAAVVAAQNQAELDAGRRLMAGELSHRLRPAMDNLAQTLALIEAEIDFSDQEVRFLSADEVARRICEIDADLTDLLRNSVRLARLSHEPRIVLAGRPNAGKSTLLNALSQSARAVVSATAGTTRDALSVQAELNRGFVCLIDVAGLEDQHADSEIESAMQRRAQIELEKADAVILVRDSTDDRPALQLLRAPDLTVFTKKDLLFSSSALSTQHSALTVSVSAVTSEGMPALRTALDALAFGREHAAAELALTTRHIQAISDARTALQRAANTPAELMAAELRQALDALGGVLGDVSPDDILGRIFSTFCIGK